MRIENEYLAVEVTVNGGSLTSIFNKKLNKEMLYQKDERSWMGQDVVIFPVIARLKDQEYIYDSEVFKMKNHGLVRYGKLDVIDHKDNEITLGYKYNDETLKQYPFKFNFEVRYVLNGNELMIEYRVYNLDDKDMYFNVGGHPAFIVDGFETETEFVYEDVKLIFDSEYEVDQFFLNEAGSFISYNDLVLLPEEFNITKDIIEEAKTLIYDVSDINEVTLVSKDKKIVFDISKCNVLAIWTNPGFGNYICVEPWWGTPDFECANKVLEDKANIQVLPSNDKYITDYKIKFE